MKNRFLLSGGVLLLIAVMSGCTKDPVNNLSNDESRIYITNHADSTDFGSYATFSITDSVAIIQNNQLVKKERTSFDADLINAFIDQMQQRGYALVSKDNDPDIGVTVSRLYNDYSGIVDYGSYWDYYGGYWDPYYWGYGGYPYYYPSFYGVYTIKDGAIETDMFDLKNAASTNELNYLWSGMIRGSGTFDQNKIGMNVQALFDQSSYLKNN